jgi:CHASE2 domain-containing sensor protein
MTKAPKPSADARAWGAGAACLAIAVLVCVFTYVLRALDFAPLRDLIIKEDHLYDMIRSPDIRLLSGAHTVVFIDINDAAVTRWDRPDDAPPPTGPLTLPNNTPRQLIGQLAGFARAAQAKVIYLDFDFRNTLPDDGRLHDELAKTDQPLILIPTFFTSGRLPACEDQGDAQPPKPPTELATVFAGLTELPKNQPPGSEKKLPSIALVHPVLTLGAYGLPEGVCSSYRVRFGPERELVWREAAMVRAVQLATADPSACTAGDPCIQTPDLGKPGILPIRWTIGNDVTEKHASVDTGAKTGAAKTSVAKTGVAKTSAAKVDSISASNDQKLAYLRLEAGSLVKYHDVPTPTDGKFAALKDAIVVIGSTAQWSEDTLATPLGDLQGVLAHVNFALSLQSVDDEASIGLQFLLDFVFAGAAALAAVYFCWRPTFRALPLGAPLPMRLRLRRSISEAGVFVGCGLFFAAGSAALLSSGARFLAGWRFGILSLIVGAIVGLMIEVCSAIADGMRDWVEDRMTRRSHLHPNTAQQRRASIGSPREPTSR